jgi:hypothetical protein
VTGTEGADLLAEVVGDTRPDTADPPAGEPFSSVDVTLGVPGPSRGG